MELALKVMSVKGKVALRSYYQRPLPIFKTPGSFNKRQIFKRKVSIVKKKEGPGFDPVCWCWLLSRVWLCLSPVIWDLHRLASCTEG